MYIYTHQQRSIFLGRCVVERGEEDGGCSGYVLGGDVVLVFNGRYPSLGS